MTKYPFQGRNDVPIWLSAYGILCGRNTDFCYYRRQDNLLPGRRSVIPRKLGVNELPELVRQVEDLLVVTCTP